MRSHKDRNRLHAESMCKLTLVIGSSASLHMCLQACIAAVRTCGWMCMGACKHECICLHVVAASHSTYKHICEHIVSVAISAQVVLHVRSHRDCARLSFHHADHGCALE